MTENDESSSIQVHPLTNDPTAAWKEISRTQKVIKVNVKIPTNPVGSDKLRVVCMSDTHSLTGHLKFQIPDGDVFIHAGDFTRCGGLKEVEEFNSWLSTLPHKHKIVIAGNHELSFDPTFSNKIIDDLPTLGIPKEQISDAVKSNMRASITSGTYLQDEFTVICGVKIYGTPWQPEFCKWAFNVTRGAECLKKWHLIPSDVDVLVTHTPPLGHGDLCCSGVRAGCAELLTTVQKRVKPKYHVFGHVHEGYGVSSDGKIIFINASTCDINYLPNNLPVVFDIAIAQGYTKD